MKSFGIGVAPKNNGVLIFHAWRNKIPAGVQVLHQCGGSVVVPPSEDAPVLTQPPENVRFGFDSFLAQCSITSVVVSEAQGGYCRVYVNWEVNLEQPSGNVWWNEGPYRTFLRSLFVAEYKSAKLRIEGDKISLIFSDKPASARVETKIMFVAAQHNRK